MSQLRLTADELMSLAQQGFVSCEQRGSRRAIYKLRFRHAGRQVVRSLSSDPLVASRVKAFLTRHQKRTHIVRELRRNGRQARGLLRTTKQRLKPTIEQAGYTFHGLALRRQRPRPTADVPTTAQSQTHAEPTR